MTPNNLRLNATLFGADFTFDEFALFHYMHGFYAGFLKLLG